VPPSGRSRCAASRPTPRSRRWPRGSASSASCSTAAAARSARRASSEAGRLDNLAIQQLLPAGLEIENPRLATSEALPWTRSSLQIDHLDVRDDRLLVFASLDRPKQRTYYALLRAVAPGSFRLPPIQVEAMYDPAIRFTGERGELQVRARQ
jgi:uncharacterized protein YfaS (alpha-2-macroglobulin family)